MNDAHFHTRKDELAVFWIPSDTDISMEMKVVGNTWQAVKDMVGGYVERVWTPLMPELYCGCSMIMLVDENAKLKQREMNIRASILAPNDYVTGDVLMLGEGPEQPTDPDEDWAMGWFSLPQVFTRWEGPGNPIPSQPESFFSNIVVDK